MKKLPQASVAAKYILLPLFFLSGMSGLIYEITWLRYFSRLFGNSFSSASLLVAVFMGGLSAGSYFAGRYFNKNKDELLKWYAVLEIATVISAIVATVAIINVAGLYTALFSAVKGSAFLVFILQLAVTSAILIVPTMMMGATLPLMVQFFTQQEDYSRMIGRLYFINTIGAAVGAYASGFIFIRYLGMKSTVLLALIINGTAALSAYAYYLAAFYKKESGVESSGKDNAPGATGTRDGVSPNLVRALIFVIGFASLGFEMLWIRFLLPFIGNTTYAFSAVLTVFLAGIALGSFIFSFLVTRIKNPSYLLALMPITLGLYLLLTETLVVAIPGIGELSRRPMHWYGQFHTFSIVAGLVLIPTVIFGGFFPVAGKIYKAGTKTSAGSVIGDLYSWNTLGAISGSLLTPWILFPLIGVTKTWYVLAFLTACAGAAAALMTSMGRRWKIAAFIAVAVPCIAVYLYLPDSLLLSIYKHHNLRYPVIFHHDGPGSSVTVTEGATGRELFVDGAPVAGQRINYVSSSRFLAHVPMLFHPNPQNVFILGFGGGGTAYSASLYPSVKSIDIAEIDRTVPVAAEYFQSINGNILKQSNVKLTVDDGRAVLLTAGRKYDVISVDLLFPQTACSGSLFTREFYRTASGALNENGIFVEWLNASYTSKELLFSIVRTAMLEFKYVSLWWTTHFEHVILVASQSDYRKVSYKQLERRMHASESVNADLRSIGITNPSMLLGYYIAGETKLAGADVGNTVTITDDRPYIEFELPFVSREIMKNSNENDSTLGSIKESIADYISEMPEDQKVILGQYDESIKLLAGAISSRNPMQFHLFCAKAEELPVKHIEYERICRRKKLNEITGNESKNIVDY